MNELLTRLKTTLPHWAIESVDLFAVIGQVAAIAFAAWVLIRLTRRAILRVSATYGLPHRVALVTRRVIGFLIIGAALLWSLERMGVSATVLWSAFTGFATVGAVAFFAAWSVLSNLFCALLIFTTRAFRVGDLVELVDSADKPGLRGRVLDINLVYTTLGEEPVDAAGGGSSASAASAASAAGAAAITRPMTTLHVPNSLFFQKALRRWPQASTSGLSTGL